VAVGHGSHGSHGNHCSATALFRCPSQTIFCFKVRHVCTKTILFLFFVFVVRFRRRHMHIRVVDISDCNNVKKCNFGCRGARVRAFYYIVRSSPCATTGKMEQVLLPVQTIRAAYAELGRSVHIALRTQMGDAAHARLGIQRA
jgi:hypothetical protein